MQLDVNNGEFGGLILKSLDLVFGNVDEPSANSIDVERTRDFRSKLFLCADVLPFLKSSVILQGASSRVCPSVSHSEAQCLTLFAGDTV